MNWKDAMWLGIPREEIEEKKIYHGDMTGRFAYYRHSFLLEEAGAFLVNISANTRYRLWVNGNPVASGPCKGDAYRYFYETLDLTQYLLTGKNVLAVQVLYQEPHTAVYQTDQRAAIYSVYGSGGGHRFALEGSIVNAAGNEIHVSTTGSAVWRVWLEDSYFLKSDSVTEYLGAVCEDVDCSRILKNWKTPAFDDSRWRKAVSLDSVLISGFMKSVGLLQRFPVQPRPIPLMHEKEALFVEESGSDTGILQEGMVTIPAGRRQNVILDAGAEVNGYPRFFVKGGKGSRLEVTYLEKFTGERAVSKLDAINGEASGLTDRYLLSGEDCVIEPFWYRTFRFIVITVESEEDTVLYAPAYRKTGYPLCVESRVESSEKWVNDVWEICVRTLENCMMETYMDCPYYEQNQFPMDTRLQALFCAAVSRDARLTRKALEDFHSSIMPDGLIHGRYPSVYPQVISTFSLYYIFMLEECYQQNGEITRYRRYLPDVDRILGYYHDRVGSDGLVGRLGYWEFVDWQPAWEKTGGIPEALEHGPSTIINLMYALALEKGAVLMEAARRAGVAEEYRSRRAQILECVQRLCWDEKRQMFREGPDFEQYSRHAQSWAVLNGILTRNQAAETLKQAIQGEDVLRCSFSTSFEWFRALEAAGLYEWTRADMEDWIKLPQMGNTTCPETPDASRSECHAWSALPMYEFIRVMAGIRETADGIRIIPNPAYLKDLKGEAVTKYGCIAFDYRRKENGWQYHLILPERADAVFVCADGRQEKLVGGREHLIED